MNPYLMLAAILGLGGALVGAYFRGEHAANASWEARWTAQEAAYARVAAQAQDRNNELLTQATQRNAEVMHDLEQTQADRDRAQSDADLARRLLSARPPAHPGPVPQAADQPGPAPTSGAHGWPSLESVLTAAIGECERNGDRLDALIAELRPQL